MSRWRRRRVELCLFRSFAKLNIQPWSSLNLVSSDLLHYLMVEVVMDASVTYLRVCVTLEPSDISSCGAAEKSYKSPMIKLDTYGKSSLVFN
jgi:hypothetical protein